MKPRIRSLALLPSLAIVGIGLVLPGLLMLAYSFLRYVPGRITDFTLSIENYLRLFGDFFYLGVVVRTLQLGVIVTVLSLLLAYPVAYYLARTTSRFKGVLTYLVFLPMMVGIVVRAYGWIVILGREGLLNTGLQSLGVVDEPVRLLYSMHAVVLALVEVLLPFMIMPILSSLEKIDRHVEEAARAAGATPMQAFLRVTLPLSFPGVVSGSLLVFSLSITAYALPALLGGTKVKLIAALAYDAMLVGYNWPFGSAIGIFMGLVSGTVVYLYLRTTGRRGVAR
jgi:putative spermidine/putrescine transport system permease protein